MGCPSNPAEFMVKGLDAMLTYDFLKGINILFIVGDVFDRGLPVNHRDVPFIVSWIRRLLARCARTGTMVIVLEGTPSHDRLQSHLFVAINDAAEPEDKCELRYVKEVSIEYIEKYDIHLLCIPDEKNTSDEVTYRQVMDMMEARALEKVDFGIMHGFFEFQVPVGRHSRFHSSEAYLDIVRYLIFIGHDHEFRREGRIIVQGSPDRQRHGMETPKGFVHATVNRDGSYTATFQVNEHAMDFKTVEVDEDLDAAHLQVLHTCDSLRPHNHVRIAARRGHPVLAAIDTYQSLYPFLHFSKKVLDEEEVDTTTVLETTDEADYVPFTIDSSNIKTIIVERLGITLNNDAEREYFDELMTSVM
ncbi:hypothetical protein [Ralstonia phage RSL2]|uniref:Uncharacterized protein n=2 Tax=Ralstonia phage RSL2 TaxID=1585840 RepID=A0A0A8J8I8_9CAUD|nr:hypothetical protein [Ralstonia phage RSL2]